VSCSVCLLTDCVQISVYVAHNPYKCQTVNNGLAKYGVTDKQRETDNAVCTNVGFVQVLALRSQRIAFKTKTKLNSMA
jgi:hypothetical protein